MKDKIEGAALVLGDNIDTDQIYPGRYLELVEPAEIGVHCLEGVDPEIPRSFVKGGIIVAGRNFGCGSSREHAPIALLSMGASAVLAESFARIFFRNGINLGLPLITCPGIGRAVKNGDLLQVLIRSGEVFLPGRGMCLKGQPLQGEALEILEAGGIKALFKSRLLEDSEGEERQYDEH